MFKKNGLSQDGAQELIDFYVKRSQEAAEAPFKYWREMNDKWLGQIKNDGEYRGDMKGLVGGISKFIDTVTGNDVQLNKDFRAAMDLTGAGNNPAFVKFMHRLGQQYNEGSYVKPGGPSAFGQRQPGSGERPSPAKALYPGLA